MNNKGMHGVGLFVGVITFVFIAILISLMIMDFISEDSCQELEGSCEYYKCKADVSPTIHTTNMYINQYTACLTEERCGE